jgi:uncharacterized membrane protein
MSPLAVGLVLASALLHTVWNAGLKITGDKRCFNAWLLILTSVVATGPALYALARGAHIGPATWRLVLVSSLLQWAYYELLAFSYARADLSIVYPVSRASSPVAATLLAAALGEWPTWGGAQGTAAIVVGVWLMSGAPTRWRELRQPGIVGALGVGVLTALYMAVDREALRSCPVLVYYWLEAALAGLWVTLATWRLRGAVALGLYLRGRAAKVLTAAAGCYGAYILVLTALTMAPSMYVVALRGTAVLWSVLVGGLALREEAWRRRLLCSVLMVGGIVLIAVYGR